MQEAMWTLTKGLAIPLFGILVVMAIFIFIYWLFAGDGIDKLKHPEEYKNKGMRGERSMYLQLVQKYHIPENQLFRNVYIPTDKGTTEVDLILVSKKGIFVFECKNYSGNVYGDGSKKNWIQYVGKKKSFFLSPVMQNRGHVYRLKEHFASVSDLPVIPVTVTTNSGKWKLKNIDPKDNVLGSDNRNFGDIYKSYPDSEIIAKHFNRILSDLRKYERPDETVKEAHIEQIKK